MPSKVPMTYNFNFVFVELLILDTKQSLPAKDLVQGRKEMFERVAEEGKSALPAIFFWRSSNPKSVEQVNERVKFSSEMPSASKKAEQTKNVPHTVTTTASSASPGTHVVSCILHADQTVRQLEVHLGSETVPLEIVTPEKTVSSPFSAAANATLVVGKTQIKRAIALWDYQAGEASLKKVVILIC